MAMKNQTDMKNENDEKMKELANPPLCCEEGCNEECEIKCLYLTRKKKIIKSDCWGKRDEYSKHFFYWNMCSDCNRREQGHICEECEEILYDSDEEFCEDCR